MLFDYDLIRKNYDIDLDTYESTDADEEDSKVTQPGEDLPFSNHTIYQAMRTNTKRNLILEATERELRDIFEKEGWDEYYTFASFLLQHKKNGCKIIKD